MNKSQLLPFLLKQSAITAKILFAPVGFIALNMNCHHIFYCEGVEEILNLQPRGASAKTYQVKQVRNMVLKYKLSEEKL